VAWAEDNGKQRRMNGGVGRENNSVQSTR
jgi:hypothetical protein